MHFYLLGCTQGCFLTKSIIYRQIIKFKVVDYIIFLFYRIKSSHKIIINFIKSIFTFIALSLYQICIDMS